MTDLLPVVTGVLLVTALSTYVLFGGADFGGGVLEATLPGHLRRKLQSTLAPVWEANHVWLIAAVVIMFVGLPRFYAALMTRLYFPINLALLGILVRGTFFTLRKYDPDRSGRRLYSLLFRSSSALAPLAFGLVLGGLLSVHPGGLARVPTLSFATVYIWPWLHGFGFAIGAFILCLFGYLAAVFFSGEVDTDEDRALLRRRAHVFFALTFVLGGAVLGLGALTGRVPVAEALTKTFIVCQVAAAVGIVVVERALRANRPWRARFAAGVQVFAILGGWYGAQHPYLLRTEEGGLTLQAASAPPITQLWLAIGTVAVLIVVVPLLVLLYRVFTAPARE
jgi:cytochrome bd ubiquinol oxidase subunit II